jgi:hypothetical protein
MQAGMCAVTQEAVCMHATLTAAQRVVVESFRDMQIR